MRIAKGQRLRIRRSPSADVVTVYVDDIIIMVDSESINVRVLITHDYSEEIGLWKLAQWVKDAA